MKYKKKLKSTGKGKIRSTRNRSAYMTQCINVKEAKKFARIVLGKKNGPCLTLWEIGVIRCLYV